MTPVVKKVEPEKSAAFEPKPTSELQPSVIYDKTFKPALVASKFATPEPEKMIQSPPPKAP
jgi:hypothetical protein